MPRTAKKWAVFESSEQSGAQDDLQALKDLLENDLGDTKLQGKETTEAIAEIIKELDNRFDINDYKVDIHNTGEEQTALFWSCYSPLILLYFIRYR